MAQLPPTRRLPRNRALGGCSLGSEDLRADQAEAATTECTRALPDADLDAFASRRWRHGSPGSTNGDPPTQAPGQHQPAAGRRARCRVGCVHCFARATRRAGWDQSADGSRLPPAGGCRKSAGILPGPNRALRPALGAKLACPDPGRKIGNDKRPARNRPASKPSGDGCVECPASPKGWWFLSAPVCEVWAHRLLNVALRASMRPSIRRPPGIRSLPASSRVRIGSTITRSGG